MNSISYLDSILTRSLTTSRSGSGTSTPAAGAASSSSNTSYGSGALGERHGNTAHLSRRASDYSLAREREREKRKLAATLGLTSLDGDRHRQEGISRRSSRKSSRSGSARHSESEQAPSDDRRASKSTSAGDVRKSRASDGGAPVTPRHPKSHSEGYYDDDHLQQQQQQQRLRLKRAGSTPAPLSAPSLGWSSLWGFGNFLENSGHGSYDSYTRRTSSHSLRSASRAERQRQQGGSVDSGSGGEAGQALDLGGATLTRRASMGDAQSSLAGFAPDALLSEREREDVVEFEGYDPDDDLHPSAPHAPPSTPFPGTQTPADIQTTPTKTESAAHQSDESDRNASTASRLSSLLFGALNPLTDDYFGPQLTQYSSTSSRRRLSEASSSERKRRGASRRSSHVRKDSQSEASSSGHGHAQQSEKTQREDVTPISSPASKVEEKAAHIDVTHGSMPIDPPPPYSDISPSTSSTSLLLPSPGLHSDSSSTPKTKSGRRKRASSFLVRGVKVTFEVLRRIILMILLSPYRLYQYSRRGARRSHLAEAHAVLQSAASAPSAPARHSSGSANTKGLRTASQAERLSSARHQQGRQIATSDGSEVGALTSQDDGEQATKQSAGEKAAEVAVHHDTDDEVITEDQAVERAMRRARRDALQSHDNVGSMATQQQQRPRLSSRLLPNPNPVDPLLAHDRTAKTASEKAEREEQERLRQLQLQRQSHTQSGRAAIGAANGGSVPIGRAPTSSSLIHHSPKVLVLDLDETLIHSTSRSPTWSALADKSKSRLAVTTGGSLLGFDGLGGVLGLRGQVGVRPHQVEVVLDGRSLIYHVYKRPHVETFLRKVASWYHVVVFTASVQEYADPVIDWLDQGRGLISARLFRESCTFRNGSYYKNLSLIDADLSRICLVDNSPASYMINQANGIPIEGWTHDPSDEALLDLLPVLDSLRFASDVRHILGIRGFSDPALKPGIGR